MEGALSVLRRRKWAVIIALICVPLAAYLVSSAKEKKYTATATLLFESGEGGEETRVAATHEALAGLPVIAVKTSKDMGGKVPAGEILESIKPGSANEMANLTTIAATTPDPELSAEIANAYSKAYVDFLNEAAQKNFAVQIRKVESEIEDLSESEETGIRSEKLNERLAVLELEKSLQTGRTSLVQPAGVPTSASSPKTKKDTIVGVIVGLLLGLVLAALMERIDRRVRTVEELGQRFGLPLLAEVPNAKGLAGTNLAEVLREPEAEAFRSLRANLRYFNVDSPQRTILVASPEPNDGKSTVARGLGAAMAQLGDSVILVEADLRKPSSLAGGHGVSPRQGLSTVLTGQPLNSALVEIPVAGERMPDRVLWMLPNGPIPPNPAELLESDSMRRLMEGLAERFDTIIIDSPALGFVSDVLALARMSSEVIAVGAVGKTKRDDIAEFRRRMSLTGQEPVGMVATMTKFDRSQYSHYMRGRQQAVR